MRWVGGYPTPASFSRNLVDKKLIATWATSSNRFSGFATTALTADPNPSPAENTAPIQRGRPFAPGQRAVRLADRREGDTTVLRLCLERLLAPNTAAIARRP